MKIYPLDKDINLDLNIASSDKSISQRGAIISLITGKKTILRNFLFSLDAISALEILKKLGAKIRIKKGGVFIKPPLKFNDNQILDCGNSGTLARILCGVLPFLNINAKLIGDSSLSKRPMDRVTKPLNSFGVEIYGDNLPILIKPSKINFFTYENKISSAQVKSALLLAGVLNKGCKYKESFLSRDHSEKLIKKMGINLYKKDGFIIIKKSKINPLKIDIKNDPSSAFYFAVLISILKNSRVVLKDVLLNKTRIYAYKILSQMGVIINFKNIKKDYEIYGDIEVISPKKLNPVVVDKNISWLIDEIPALSIAMIFANGASSVKNASELRKKESDRIKSLAYNFNKIGVKFEEFEDGFKIYPLKKECKDVVIKSFDDHRIAMSFAILGAKIKLQIDDVSSVDTSFKNFFKILNHIGVKFES